jgi:ABC-2 type transport system permease protein
VNLLRSEWVKLWTTRTTWVMIGAGLLIEALFAGLLVGLASLEELDNFRQIGNGTGMLLVLILVLGVLIATTEFRHGTASSTFLASPRRYPALAAKLGVALAVGLLAGLAFVLINGGLAVPLLHSREAPLPSTSHAVAIYVGVTASMALICAFGFGVGAIVRNQVGAIIAAIAFFFVISPLPELLPGDIGHYFPAQCVGSLQGNAEGLSQVAGGLVLAGWALALALIGTLLICRRDVS